jgi:prepilin-type N-terminal cleavage/methylation domain-containing protein
VNLLRKSEPFQAKSAFSLIEMVAVIAILVTLMTAGITLLNGTGTQSRKAGTDMLSGMIEQARTTAITSRCYVILAIAEPGDLPIVDERCRIGMFKVEMDKWPTGTTSPVTVPATLLNRWQMLNTGIVLIGKQKTDSDPEPIPNPIDLDKITINYGGAKNLSIKVHAIAFNSRGGLHSPPGSTPVVLRIAEGGYRGGEAKPNIRSGQTKPTENRLKIGRVTARPYQIEG